jgi:hypothetical protein
MPTGTAGFDFRLRGQMIGTERTDRLMTAQAPCNNQSGDETKGSNQDTPGFNTCLRQCIGATITAA